MGVRVRSTGAAVFCRAPRVCPMSATHGMAHPWLVDGGHDPPAPCSRVGDDPSWAGSSSIVKWAKVHQELLSGFGFRQNLKVRTLGCARGLCPLPLRLAKI